MAVPLTAWGPHAGTGPPGDPCCPGAVRFQLRTRPSWPTIRIRQRVVRWRAGDVCATAAQVRWPQQAGGSQRYGSKLVTGGGSTSMSRCTACEVATAPVGDAGVSLEGAQTP